MADKKTILIVDDEEDILSTMSFRLEKAGYRVCTASNGIDGVEIASKEVPDIILLDIMMPGIDGFETLKRLKGDSVSKRIPVLIVSCGKAEEEWAKRALMLGAAGYVVKPFDTQSLLFTVERMLSGGRR